MTKSKKKKQQKHKNAEEVTSSTTTAAKPSSSATKNEAVVKKENEVVVAVSRDVEESMSDINLPYRHLNDTSFANVKMEMRSEECRAIGKCIQMESTSVSTETPNLKNENTQLVSLEEVIIVLKENTELNNKVNTLLKELECAKKDQERELQEHQKTVSILSTVLATHSKWYLTLQKSLIMEHVNNSHNMVRDLTTALPLLSYLSHTGAFSLEDCHQQIAQWTTELQKAKRCLELFQLFQHQLNNSLYHNNFMVLPEPPLLFTQLCKPNDILHDSFVPAFNMLTKAFQHAMEVFKQNQILSGNTHGHNQTMPKNLPHLSQDLASLNLNGYAKEEETPTKSNISKSVPTDSAETSTDSLWLKKLRRIHANSPPDVELDQEKNVTSRLNCQKLYKSKQMQDPDNRSSNRVAAVDYGSPPSLAGAVSKNKFALPSVKTTEGFSFDNLHCYITERFPDTDAYRVLCALKRVKQKKTRLSGMTRNEIVVAVQEELNNTGEEGYIASDYVEVSRGKEQCSICLQRFKKHPTSMLKCGHFFHVKCIKGWISNEPLCPLCQQHVSPDEDIFYLAGGSYIRQEVL